ncbi:MAG: nitrate/nitrite transporter [Bacteroidia bacterium]
MSANEFRAPKWILPIIVISQFCCTSLWFAGNGVMPDLIQSFQLADSALSYLTSAVQFGFISGTLLFALLTIADRFSPSKVFLISAILGAIFNLGVIIEDNTLFSLLGLRFSTGFFLAGIYPVGMKIAADYFDKGLGKSLGFLVGALVLGTAFPHLLQGLDIAWEWSSVLIITSSLAVLGGVLMLVFVPDGPYRKASQKLDFGALSYIFRNLQFRKASLGYLGHMWELYSFWAFVPLMLTTFLLFNPEANLNISLWAFMIIAIGSIACVIGGYLAQVYGSTKIASLALILSGLCCVLSPLFFLQNSATVFVGFLIFWGMVVIMDSPLLSSLVAQSAPAESKGTALTIVNSMGFSLTIISIQLLGYLNTQFDPRYIYLVLALGPIFGLLGLTRKTTQEL